jgi:hypothetical protein
MLVWTQSPDQHSTAEAHATGEERVPCAIVVIAIDLINRNGCREGEAKAGAEGERTPKARGTATDARAPNRVPSHAQFRTA